MRAPFKTGPAAALWILTTCVCVTRSGAQVEPPPPPGTATATVVPGERYQAGGFRRWLLGDTYRDLWCTPITVPVLDVRTYAGGLKPTKIGGGKQTKSLRFLDAHGNEFVFRLVDKDKTNPPAGWEKTIVDMIARDQVSAHHPANAVVADRFLIAAGVLHPTPMLVVMPDDTTLGKFREEFAGQLGFIEPYPNVPEDGAGFAGAIEIIETDSLLTLLDRNPDERIDTQAYLTARMTDMFMNDWDRHEGNWKWARTEFGGVWRPLPRDRDKVMLGYGGIVPYAGKMVPPLIRFESKYPHMNQLVYQSPLMDRRLLSGLEASAFDSTAAFLVSRFTDAVIDSALHAMPVEFHPTIPEQAAKFKARRDALPVLATEFYQYFLTVVDIHGTDAPEHATVTFVDGQHIEIEIRPIRTPGESPEVTRVAGPVPTGTDLTSLDEEPYYTRRFKAGDTRELRLYMHDGDDRVDVRGEAKPAMLVRIIGGNGNNEMNTEPGVDADSDDIRFYDEGPVDDVHYPDTPTFDRRPLVRHAHMERILPSDQGANSRPFATLRAPGDLGLMPGVGVQKVRYGFRSYPYEYKLKALGEYATGVDGWRVTGTGDKRWEENRLHMMATARMSEVEVLNFYGYGNDSPASGPASFHELNSREWLFHPTLAYAVGTRSDLAFGPIVKYMQTESANNFVTTEAPYGFGDFGQAGLRLGLYSDSRDHSRGPGRKILLDLTASYYPKAWDVQSDFGALAAITATYLTLPVPLRPILALKVGGRQLFGDYPYHESAFIGGRPTERGLERERYAGDASVYGTAELRVPLFDFAVLLPFNFGVYVYNDAARVYMDRKSPGGWHDTRGVGMWISVLNPANALSIESSEGSGLQAKLGWTF